MPGMIAIAGVNQSAWERLLHEFCLIWPQAKVESLARFRISAHAHRGVPHFRDLKSRTVCVDGEVSIYHSRHHLDLDLKNTFAFLSNGFLQLGPDCKGNLVVADDSEGQLYFASEWTATFPLYYLQLNDCLLVSSHLRVLGRPTTAEPDTAGVLQFLRFGYNVAGRTLFTRIQRVLPGQSFCYDIKTGQLETRECSRFWTGFDKNGGHPEKAWDSLKAATQRCAAGSDRLGIMLSGGWDSRTLLAATQTSLGGGHLLGYSHGDVRSRELGLVQRLARSVGTECDLEPIDDLAYDLDALAKGFARVESVVFPHWHRAGLLLSHKRVLTATAGVYGEVLGGHYGPAMRLEGMAKIMAVANGLLGIGHDSVVVSPEILRSDADALFQLKTLPRPWTVKEDFWRSCQSPLEHINADIATALLRLVDRGISNLDQLIEAFITEHRGTQYINNQLLSCRALVDVALPFTDQESLGHATRIPLSEKIHNRINQRMLAANAPGLLAFPLAATLVAAKQPIVLQEASRLIRRLKEEAQWKLHFVSHGKIQYPRLGWVDFEFLRDGKSLFAIVEDLRSHIWDKNAMHRYIASSTAGTVGHSLHPLSDAMMKVFTVDLMLRAN